MVDKECVAETSWTCPFCNHAAFLRADDTWTRTAMFNSPLTPTEGYAYLVSVHFCPNKACNKTQIELSLLSTNKSGPRAQDFEFNRIIRRWSIMPESAAKPFPAYIPRAIREDYAEACLIVGLSPKASATLSRRCLQGMIRDFWGISKARLKDEIEALENKVDPITWQAVDAVRKIGNIGAHMEADINVIVDVDPAEAELLVGLIETLLADWYVARNNREERMLRIKAAADAKEPPRKSDAV